MNRQFKYVVLIALILSSTVSLADSFRCGRKIVKEDESSNALIKKCGDPVRKFSSKHLTTIEGRQKRVSVSNWVYSRRGKKDMIVSIYDGTVINIQVD
jgi:hypothetical protein